MRRLSRIAPLLVFVAIAAAFSSPAVAQRGPLSLWHESLPMPGKIDAIFLAADTPVQVTVPTCEGKPCDFVVFAVTGGRFWNRIAASCAVPTTTVTNGTAAEPNPSARTVAGLVSFCVVTDEADVVVYLLWYRLRV